MAPDGSNLPPLDIPKIKAGRPGLDALKTSTSNGSDASSDLSQNRPTIGNAQLTNGIIENIRETHGVSFNPDQIKSLPPAQQREVWDALRKYAPNVANLFDEEDPPGNDKDDKEKLLFLAELLGGAGAAAETADAAVARHRRHRPYGRYAREAMSAERAGKAAVKTEKEAALLRKAEEEARKAGRVEEAAKLEQQAIKLEKLKKVARIGKIARLGKIVMRVGKMSLYGFIIKRLAEGGIIYELAPEGKKEQWAKDVALRSPFSAAARTDFAQGKYVDAVLDEGKGFFADIKGLANFASRFVADPKKAIDQGKKDLDEARDGIDALVALYKEDPALAKKMGRQVLADAGLFGDVVKENPNIAAELAHNSFMGNDQEAGQNGKQLALAAAQKPGVVGAIFAQAPEVGRVMDAVRPPPNVKGGIGQKLEDNNG